MEGLAYVDQCIALENVLKAHGKDWKTFSRPEMRSLVCGNCHVEYYFVGKEKLLTFSWGKGTQTDQIWDYYQTCRACLIIESGR